MPLLMKSFSISLFLFPFLVLAAPHVEVHGHRGARALRPENTLPAFELALQAKVDVLELDLAVTKEGRLVISHDPLISPAICQSKDGKPIPEKLAIHFLSLEQVQSYDCGSLKNPKFPKQIPVPGTSIPTLEQLFEWIKTSKLPQAAKVKFNIETKIFPSHPEITPTPKVFVQKIIDLVKRYGFTERVILQSFDDRTLKAAKEIEPRIRTALLTSDNHIDYVKAVKAAKADSLSPDADWILPEDVEKLHQAGIPVIPWTANDPKTWDRLLKMKVDGIITDEPVGLMEYLKGMTSLEAQSSLPE